MGCRRDMYSPNKRISIASVSVGLDPQALHQRECPVAVDPPGRAEFESATGVVVFSANTCTNKSRGLSQPRISWRNSFKSKGSSRQFKID